MNARVSTTLQKNGLQGPAIGSLEKPNALFALTKDHLLYEDNQNQVAVHLRDLTRIHSDNDGTLRVETKQGTAFQAHLGGYDPSTVQSFFALVRDTTAVVKRHEVRPPPPSVPKPTPAPEPEQLAYVPPPAHTPAKPATVQEREEGNVLATASAPAPMPSAPPNPVPNPVPSPIASPVRPMASPLAEEPRPNIAEPSPAQPSPAQPTTLSPTHATVQPSPSSWSGASHAETEKGGDGAKPTVIRIGNTPSAEQKTTTGVKVHPTPQSAMGALSELGERLSGLGGRSAAATPTQAPAPAPAATPHKGGKEPKKGNIFDGLQNLLRGPKPKKQEEPTGIRTPISPQVVVVTNQDSEPTSGVRVVHRYDDQPQVDLKDPEQIPWHSPTGPQPTTLQPASSAQIDMMASGSTGPLLVPVPPSASPAFYPPLGAEPAEEKRPVPQKQYQSGLGSGLISGTLMSGEIDDPRTSFFGESGHYGPEDKKRAEADEVRRSALRPDYAAQETEPTAHTSATVRPVTVSPPKCPEREPMMAGFDGEQSSWDSSAPRPEPALSTLVAVPTLERAAEYPASFQSGSLSESTMQKLSIQADNVQSLVGRLHVLSGVLFVGAVGLGLYMFVLQQVTNALWIIILGIVSAIVVWALAEITRLLVFQARAVSLMNAPISSGLEEERL